jgi:hypothetical protein
MSIIYKQCLLGDKFGENLGLKDPYLRNLLTSFIAMGLWPIVAIAVLFWYLTGLNDVVFLFVGGTLSIFTIISKMEPSHEIYVFSIVLWFIVLFAPPLLSGRKKLNMPIVKSQSIFSLLQVAFGLLVMLGRSF